MLTYNTSSTSAKVRRAKSSSSVRLHPSRVQYAVSYNRNIAHDHAITAAEIAFERAKERCNGIRMGKEDESGGAVADQNEHSGLNRQKSIRFAGPSAAPIRSCSITRRIAPECAEAHKSAARLDNYGADVQHSAAKSLASSSTQGCEEFVEHELASQPSSYRKLRKAKSMFTPGKTPSAVFPNGVPIAGRHFQRQSVRSSDSWGESIQPTQPTLRKSFSFLHGVADRLPTSNHQYASQDEAVRLAHDQYLRQLEKQRLKEQPSLFNLVRRRRSQKALRRTVRPSNTDRYGNAIESPRPPIELFHPGGIGQKARSFSLNVKKKLRRALRLSISAGDAVPAQHLDASRAHYCNDPSTFVQAAQLYPPIPSPDAELLQSVGSRESIIRNSPVSTEEKYHSGSIRSVPSDDESDVYKSRVTSWTNSTAANTINMPSLVERKRLSVIKEDGGPHQPSLSGKQLDDVAGAYAAFRQPFRQGIAGSPLEPERIFSALQREIVKNSSHPNLDNSGSETESSLEQAKSQRSYGALRRSSGGRLIGRKPFLIPGDGDHAKAIEDLTPQQTADFTESHATLSKRPLHEVGSAFFHSSTHVEQKSTSPYRRALCSASENDSSSCNGSPAANSFQHPKPYQASVTLYNSGSDARSESVYSCTSGGHTPKAIGHSVSTMKSGVSEEPGTAVILTTATTQSGTAARFLGPHRHFSDRSCKSSGEWKNRLSCDLAYFDDRIADKETTYNVTPLKKTGHKRENAQHDGDDAVIGSLDGAKHLPKPPFGSLQPMADAQSVLKQKASHPDLDSFTPMASIGVAPLPRRAITPQNENIPPVRGQLQDQRSAGPESEQATSKTCRSPIQVRQKSSRASLTVRKANVESPGCSGSQYSLDRSERIRRLNSRSCLSLDKACSSPNLSVKGFVTENRIAFDSFNPAAPNTWLRDEGPKEIIPRTNQIPTIPASNKELVEKFLEGRRRGMRISEESANEPAFL
ncbi:MAG: hypothetical protein Q9163_003934 [Psora crenata]